MTTKPQGLFSRDGSMFATFTDGSGNKQGVVAITSGQTKLGNSIYSNDGSIYLTITNGNGTLS